MIDLQIWSPNCDERPAGVDISLLVIHNISLPPGQFGGEDILNLFTNQLDIHKHPFFQEIAHLKVSAHLFIRRNGTVIQCVPFHLRAWHAGVSSFKEKAQCNDFSIGIELEGTDDIPYAPEQYQALAQVTKMIMMQYPDITPDRIVGHADIAPGRKTDPGPAFDWALYRKSIITNY